MAITNTQSVNSKADENKGSIYNFILQSSHEEPRN